MTNVLAHESVPFVGDIKTPSRNAWLVGRATSELPRPLAQTGFDVTERSVPIDRRGTGCGPVKGDPLVVTKCSQGFDVAVVTKPTARDYVMVEMREPHNEFFHPSAEIAPLPARLERSEIRPKEGSGVLLRPG
jgi:hypothetical protein